MSPTDPLLMAGPQPMPVPASYAEKAMASLMQLHGELMEEKERRVDLYRRLMEKEQALAELKMYVKLLEERAGLRPPADFERARPATVRHPDPPPSRIDPQASEPTTWTTTPSGETAPPRVPPIPPRAGAPKDGWKVW